MPGSKISFIYATREGHKLRSFIGNNERTNRKKGSGGEFAGWSRSST